MTRPSAAPSPSEAGQHGSGRAGRAEQVAALQKQIAEHTAKLVDAGAWRQMLAVAARFHDYSLGNQILIAAQRPDATRVAGYRTWQKLGRHVRRGERGIAILAPMTFPAPARGQTSEDTGRHNSRDNGDHSAAEDTGADAKTGTGTGPPTVVRFRVVRVFDLAQTDGDPLPGLPDRLTGAADQALWVGLAALVASRGYRLTRTSEGPDGYTQPRTRTVGVREDVEDAHALMVLTHEVAHLWCGHTADGYNYLAHRGTAEVQAQSVAYIVAAAAGLDTTAYTTDYVIGWADGDTDAIRATAQKVTTAAHDILTALDQPTDGRPPAPEVEDADSSAQRRYREEIRGEL